MPYGLGIAKGMMVTLRNLVRKPVTVQYPEQRVAQHHRFRGEDFVWYEERCTGCASCAKFCPPGHHQDRDGAQRRDDAGG